MNPIEGLKLVSIDRHALPALSDGFFRKYKKPWMSLYDLKKIELAVHSVMKTLAATEHAEYTALKAAGDEVKSHLMPLSKVFSIEQLVKIPVDNKVGQNYLGEMTVQLRKKGRSAFKARASCPQLQSGLGIFSRC